MSAQLGSGYKRCDYMSCHAADLPGTFDMYGTLSFVKRQKKDDDFINRYVRYLSNFVHTGNPNTDANRKADNYWTQQTNLTLRILSGEVFRLHHF